MKLKKDKEEKKLTFHGHDAAAALLALLESLPLAFVLLSLHVSNPKQSLRVGYCSWLSSCCHLYACSLSPSSLSSVAAQGGGWGREGEVAVILTLLSTHHCDCHVVLHRCPPGKQSLTVAFAVAGGCDGGGGGGGSGTSSYPHPDLAAVAWVLGSHHPSVHVFPNVVAISIIY